MRTRRLLPARAGFWLSGPIHAAALLGELLWYLLRALVFPFQRAGACEWARRAIVGGVITLAGVIVLLAGKKRAARTTLVPAETIANAKEDARWVTRKVKYEAR